MHIGFLRLAAWQWLIACAVAANPSVADAQQQDPSPSPLELQTRARQPVGDDDGGFRTQYTTVRWDPARTAVIVCDMWDDHWCRGASARVAEMAPRMNQYLQAARQRGVLIIHAPSNCTDTYADHPARSTARNARDTDVPEFLANWNRQLPAERHAEWPLDQSDGGCDCQPPCATGQPWKRQIDTLAIHPEDAISDSGIEIGKLLAERGIDNILLLGVHTNMCVIGRPFGLRSMVQLGKNVVLVRDFTDTMYNSRRSPYVSHVRGTELMVEYIEKYVCPTVTSRSLLGGPAFRFDEDERPHVAILVSDDHYHADTTLPAFAGELRAAYGCYCTVIHGEGTNQFPAMDELAEADVAVLFIRRLAPPQSQLDRFRAFLDSGKPLVALRTASHAFDVRGEVPSGHAEWVEFDPVVLGGNYHGHGPNEAGSDISHVAEQADHPVLAGVMPAKWHSNGSLYFTAPIQPQATLLMVGSTNGRTEPVTWVRRYKRARVFYTSLGHPDDFERPQFRRLLANAIFWAMDRNVPEGR